MEERALALGGRLELSSAPGKGTTVRLQCPLVARAPASAA
jgi:signal transduction histidine kinase